MSSRTEGFYNALDDAVERTGISFAAGLPDDWTRPILQWFRDHPTVTLVDVAREAEAVGAVSGAFFTGTPAVAVMGATGLFTCLGELSTLNTRHQIPVFLLVSERGSIDDHRIYQEIQGRRLKPALESLDIPWVRFDSAASIERLPEAFVWCRVQKRPVVAFLSRDLLRSARGSTSERVG